MVPDLLPCRRQRAGGEHPRVQDGLGDTEGEGDARAAAAPPLQPRRQPPRPGKKRLISQLVPSYFLLFLSGNKVRTKAYRLGPCTM